MVIKLLYFDTTDFLEGLLGMTTEEIWKQGVDLDDWDYGLLLEGHKKSYSSVFGMTYLDSLLNGCCDNKWYEVRSKNNHLYTIGIAYHA